MKKILRKISLILLAACRIIVVGLLLVALGSSGANAAARLFSDCPVKNLSSAVQFKHKLIIPDVVNSEEKTGAMAPGTRPYTEQDAYLISQVFIKANNDDKQIKINIITDFNFVIFNSTHQLSFSPVSSPGQVSSRLGRTLTLVGAKPSGTS